MNSTKKLAIVLLLLLCVACVLTACTFDYTITSEQDSYVVTIKNGESVDFKNYFTIKDIGGKIIPTTDDMIKVSPEVDFTKDSSYLVTCNYLGLSKSIVVTVKIDNSQTDDLSDVFAKYDDYEKWNFKLKFTADADDTDVANEYAYTLIYAYDGYDFYYTDLDDAFVDYVIYTSTNILYYLDNGDGTYTKLTDSDDEFTEYYDYLDFVELTALGNYQFSLNGDHYSATNPSEAGNNVLGEYDNCTYTSFDLYVTNGKITKIVSSQQDDNYNTVFTYTVELYDYDNVTVDVSDLDVDDANDSGDQGGDSTGGETQKDIVVTFSDSTGKTDLNSTGDVKFTASRKVDGWDDKRGIQFLRKNGNVAFTSTTTVNNIKSIVLDISANKEIDVIVTVKVGNTLLTYNGNTSATFQKENNLQLTFSTETAVNGTVVINVTSASTTNGSVWFKSITLSATGTSGSGSGSGDSSSNKEVMPEQEYDASNHENYDDILFDAIKDYNEKDCGEARSDGLSSQGKYNILVIPVEFSNDKFTDQELIDLESVFNNQKNTGWESVSSYYNTSSYGKLTMTFDITGKITLPNTYSYYEKQASEQATDGENLDGGNIVSLALDMLDQRGFDFSNYDYDNDGYIDGVYIIYSAPIDYNGDYYWAYVYNIDSETKYDGLYAYRYLFASVDFMYESIETSEKTDYNVPIAGLKLNASTYIHETGHMLGLDDYYDYNEGTGSDQGLGGADMMDNTVGDHNPYSKLMLGWVKPTVITETTNVTIKPFESSGEFIMILLDYNGTYFSEYLLIDLYTATRLNELHAGVDGSFLYYNSNDTGASFGARIYHVDSTIDKPYNENVYGSFTDNNNSVSKDPLIKLVEADGDKNFESDTYTDRGTTYRYASENDLWQTGDKFSEIQPYYTRHDGKLVNFDISFDSVTATSATITITFNTAE